MSGRCFACDDGTSVALAYVLAGAVLLALTLALWRFMHGSGGGPAVQVQAVLSFGSASGGFARAKSVKAGLLPATGWDSTQVYVDADALAGKTGTTSTTFVDEEGFDRVAHYVA